MSSPYKTKVARDWAFSIFLTKEIGVTTIPYSAFYDDVDELAP